MGISEFLLALTNVSSLFVRHRLFIVMLGSLVIIFAYTARMLDILGMCWFVGLLGLSFTYYHISLSKSLKRLNFGLLVLLLAGLVLHKLPGFTTLTILDKISVSPSSQPYSMYFNLDKIFPGLILFLISPLWSQERALDSKALWQTIKVWLAVSLTILAPALLTGYVRFDPKWPQIFAIWAIHNLLFVCYAEEIVYRGFLQKELQAMFSKRLSFKVVLLITSIVFGLAHYRQGAIFMLLAGICGLFYGYAYQRTQRILSAMLVHFGLNATHLLLFTYLAAKKTSLM